MLDNMISSPHPTKAEVLDISNSVLDGATATMLSGETAVGKYPIDSIKVMSKISNVIINNHFTKNKDQKNITSETMGMANAVKNLSMSLPITKIIAITVSGYAARVFQVKCFLNQLLP